MKIHFAFSPEAYDVPACIGKPGGTTVRSRPTTTLVSSDFAEVTCPACLHEETKYHDRKPVPMPPLRLLTQP